MRDTVGILPRNALEELRVSRSTFKGKAYVDIRIFYKPADGRDPLPTKKGVCLPLEELRDLLALLAKVEGEGTGRRTGTTARGGGRITPPSHIGGPGDRRS